MPDCRSQVTIDISLGEVAILILFYSILLSLQKGWSLIQERKRKREREREGGREGESDLQLCYGKVLLSCLKILSVVLTEQPDHVEI